MALQNGESELDTVTVKLIDKKKEITTWDKVSIKSDFLTPTGAWDLTMSLEDPLRRQELFQEGDKVQICINNKPQITGYLEHINSRQDRGGGLTYQLYGRDILGPVVFANVDPKIKIVESMTVLDLLNAVLKDSKIGTIYNSDDLNINIITGINKKVSNSKTKVATQIAFAKPVTGDNKSFQLEYQSETINVFKAASRPDLKTLKLKDLKPRQAEGCYDFINRVLSRLGLRMWAMADGTGVVIDRPDFASIAEHKIIRKISNNSSNNLLNGELNINAEIQPAAILASGTSLDADEESVKVKVLAINELVGLDSSGQPIQLIKDIIARNPGLKILPLRRQLVENRRKFSDSYIPTVLYLKDDESRSFAQLSAFARKQLSVKQKEYFVYTGTVAGLTFEKKPYSINTMVSILDEVLGVDEPLWVLNKSFNKTRGEGTTTNLTLIKPYTLELQGD